VSADRRPRKLFVLGGSTTFCLEVPDKYTWASQLQERLAKIPETRDIQVLNCGVTAAVSLQEVERLEYEIRQGNIPDYCVFFDGHNDAVQGVFNRNPGGTIFEVEQKYTNTPLFVTLRQLALMSVAARTIYHSIWRSQRENEPVPPSEAELRELARTTVDIYEQNMLRAKKACDRYGVRMIAFLQPHVYSIGRPWTPH
jgi:lysophospholipase L1-like esterase